LGCRVPVVFVRLELRDMRKLSRSDVLDAALGVGAAAGLVLVTARIGTAGADQRALDAVGDGCLVVAGVSRSLRHRAPVVGRRGPWGAGGLPGTRPGSIGEDPCSWPGWSRRSCWPALGAAAGPFRPSWRRPLGCW